MPFAGAILEKCAVKHRNSRDTPELGASLYNAREIVV